MPVTVVNPDTPKSTVGTDSVFVTLGIFLVAIVVIAARRPDQIAFPEAWNEDGSYIVRNLIRDGWRYIFVPVNGYLLVPSKVISYLAVRISFIYYPVVSTVLAVMAHAACVTVVARAPTVLPARLAMAAAIVFVPTDPEVFVLPVYTLWWTPFLILVALLWSGAPGSIWRSLFVIVGGISAPVVIAVLPVLAVNAAVRRHKEEIWLLIVAALVAAMQVLSIVSTDELSTNTFRLELWPVVFMQFFGVVTAGQPYALTAGLLLAGLLTAGVFLLPRGDRLPYCLLGGCLAGMIATAAYRVPVEILSPVGGGPRYFFYPYVLEMWMLIWLAVRMPSFLRAVPALILLAVVPLSLANFQRHQERLRSWAVTARECHAGVETIFETQFDGTRRNAYRPTYPVAICRQAMRNALLDRWIIGDRP